MGSGFGIEGLGSGFRVQGLRFGVSGLNWDTLSGCRQSGCMPRNGGGRIRCGGCSSAVPERERDLY